MSVRRSPWSGSASGWPKRQRCGLAVAACGEPVPSRSGEGPAGPSGRAAGRPRSGGRRLPHPARGGCRLRRSSTTGA
eukprot:7384291-Alexandrium_andersonii.AAC.1